jgi:hypothetical protein
MLNLIPHIDLDPAQDLVFDIKARPLFEHARHQAQFYHFICQMIGKRRQLACLDQHIAHTAQSTKLCVAPVAIRDIRGSVNRMREFDCDFYPLTNEVELRWLRIASMMLQGKMLPPVELIRTGDLYFVADGHHRISVSRTLGYIYVDALVHSAEP